MKSPTLNSVVLGAALLLLNAEFVRSATIAVTGYTHDVVYQVGATGSGSGTFTNETSALFETGLATNPLGTGLPSSRSLTSALDGTVFSLASYGSNNALLVGEGNGLAKFNAWTFAPGSQQRYTELQVLALSAGGGSNFSMVVYFTDGSNTSTGDPNFEGSGHFARGAFDGNVMPDWFGNGGTAAGAALTGAGRVDSNNGNDNGGGGVNIQQFNFDLSAYSTKTIASIEFESTGGGGNNRAFLAISGDLVAVPEPSTAFILLGGVGLLLVARRRMS